MLWAQRFRRLAWHSTEHGEPATAFALHAPLALILLICSFGASCLNCSTVLPPDWKSRMHPSILKDYYQSQEPSAFSSGTFEGDIKGLEIPSDDIANMQKVQNLLMQHAKNAIRDESLRWTNRSLPYIISGEFRPGEKKLILRAMKLISDQTCITFIPRNGEKDYVKFIRGFHCWSFIGRNGDEQEISLTRGCLEEVGDVAHEIYHTLGFLHEHSRTDRDDHILINWDNIASEDRIQFVKYTNATADHFSLPYDYESIMHYPFTAFAVDKALPTIVPKTRGARIGQRKKLSTLDVAKLRRLYNCDDYELSKEDREETNRDDRTASTVVPEKTEQENPEFPAGNRKKTVEAEEGTPAESGGEAEGSPDDWTTSAPSIRATSGPKLKLVSRTVLPVYTSGIPVRTTLVPTTDRIPVVTKLPKRAPAQPPVTMKQPCKKNLGFFNVPTTGDCVTFGILCDGKVDVASGWDEVASNCQQHCRGAVWINVPIGVPRCVPSGIFCDGRYDLPNGYDEMGTTCLLIEKIAARDLVLAPTLPAAAPLSKYQLCNGVRDHYSGWDENPANCRQHCAGSGYTLVPDGRSTCLLKTGFCNGAVETDNGWDEVPSNCRANCTDVLYMQKPGRDQCIRRTVYCTGQFAYRSPLIVWEEATSTLRQCPADINFVETKRGIRCDVTKKYCNENTVRFGRSVSSYLYPLLGNNHWPSFDQSDTVSEECSATREAKDYIDVSAVPEMGNQCMAVSALCNGYRLFLPQTHGPGSALCQWYNQVII